MRFALSGMGEAKPLLVQQPPGAFQRGATICYEEVELIEQEVARHAIALPGRKLSRRRPNGLTARPLPGKHSHLPGVQPVRAAGYAGWWQRLPIIGPRLPAFWPSRLRPAIAKVREVARPGPLLVVGDKHAAALAGKLARDGWNTQWAASHVASEVPARPPVDSLFSLLLGHRGELSAYGAVLLVGNHEFAQEAEAILDCVDAPPMVLATIDESGLIRTRLVTPEPGPTVLPRISLVTVSYNQAPYLEACIRSVLDQGYPDLEYIVVDGGSTDGSVDIIERYRGALSHVVIEPDDGQSDALNKGFAHATGELMNWLCSDDMLVAGALHRVAAAYARHRPDIVASGCYRLHEGSRQADFLHHSALPLGRTVMLDPLDMLQFMRSWQRSNYFYQPEVFFSRRIWEVSGAYLRPDLYYAMDYDMWLRMALAGATIRAMPFPAGVSRVHEAQKTRNDQSYLHQVRIMMLEYAEMFEYLAAAEERLSRQPLEGTQAPKLRER